MFRINTIKQISSFSKICRMSRIPEVSTKLSINKQYRFISQTLNLKNKKEYTESEEWLYHNDKSTKIGLTNKAIDELTDLVYVEFLHEKGDIIKENEDIVEIESVKATNSIAAPFDLVLLQNNEEILDNLDVINNDPENIETSWIIKVKKQ